MAVETQVAAYPVAPSLQALPVVTSSVIGGEDLLARAFLHETDHLYGKLYITHISALKRDLMKRKIKKLQRAGDWG